MWVEILSNVLGLLSIAFVVVVWGGLVSVILRLFGVRLPVLIWKPSYSAAVDKLSRVQFIVTQGILFWGLGVYWIAAIQEYVETRLRFSARPYTPAYSASHMIIWMAAGGWFGWMMWSYSHKNPYSHYDRLSINPDSAESVPSQRGPSR